MPGGLLEQPERRRQEQQPARVEFEQRDDHQADRHVADEHEQLAAQRGEQRRPHRDAVPQRERHGAQEGGGEQVRHRGGGEREREFRGGRGEQRRAEGGRDGRRERGGGGERAGDPRQFQGRSTVRHHRHHGPGGAHAQQGGGRKPAGRHQPEADHQRGLAPGDAHHPRSGTEAQPGELGNRERDSGDAEPRRAGQRVVHREVWRDDQAEDGGQQTGERDRDGQHDDARRRPAQADPVRGTVGRLGGHGAAPSPGRAEAWPGAGAAFDIGVPLPRRVRGLTVPPAEG
ncbi:hypothetical protein MCBG_03016 [Micromonospora sp. M42]|nr:hypothetical protein MCBG_03016 [Micromonospora sp. M42]